MTAPPSGSGRRRSVTERRAERAAVDDPAVVLQAAIRFLETRARSVAEVRRRLVDAGFDPALVDGAVDRLLELRLLDDEEFARAWVASRDRARPRGSRALRAELARKGIERVTIDAVLAEREETDPEDRVRAPGPKSDRRSAGPDDPADPEERGDPGWAEQDADDAAAARLLARRRATLEREPDPRRRRDRAYALLARNGFDPETAARHAERFGRD